MRKVILWFFRWGSPKWFLLVTSVLVVGGAWLFLGILEDVLTGDPLVAFDVLVHDALQALRTSGADRVFVAVTELGDVQVVLPVVMVVLVWFIAHRLWRTAIYWVAAGGVAEALVKVIKLALHRPRPASMYAGLEQFSFPSSHATLAVVVYGFLAFLLSVRSSQRARIFIGSAAALLVGTISLSRLYLGVHWMSDVLAGLSFGTAWIAALALAYVYQRGEAVPVRSLAVVGLLTFAAAATVHVVTRNTIDLARYAPVPSGTR